MKSDLYHRQTFHSDQQLRARSEATSSSTTAATTLIARLPFTDRVRETVLTNQRVSTFAKELPGIVPVTGRARRRAGPAPGTRRRSTGPLDDMSCTYRMVVDEAYARTFLKRFTQSRSPYLRIGAIAFGLLSLLGTWLFFAIEDPAGLPIISRTIAYTLLPMVVVVAVIVPLIRARQIKRIVAAAKGGASVTLSENGISTIMESSQTHAQWSAYDHALRYKDGLMLMHMKKLPILWLPDSSLIDASPEEVRSLVTKMLPSRVV